MKIIPQNNTVLCECVSKQKTQITSHIIYEQEHIPEYKIIDSSLTSNDFFIGDIIICNSTGTKIKTEDGYKYIFTYESIIGKVN